MHNPAQAKKELTVPNHQYAAGTPELEKEREASEQRANGLHGQITALEATSANGATVRKTPWKNSWHLSDRSLIRNRIRCAGTGIRMRAFAEARNAGPNHLLETLSVLEEDL